MIQFCNLVKKFEERVVLNGIDLFIPSGQILFILGTSGTGKSVLLKTLVGMFRPTSGEIWVDGQEVSHLSEEEYSAIRRKCGMVFQHPALFDSLTVFENVAFGLRKGSHGLSESEIQERVHRCLELVHVAGVEDKMPQDLSYGVQKRVSLARTLAVNPSVLLFDEPTTGLDPVTTQTINRLIFELSRQLKTTSLVVSHDMSCALAIADQIVFLDKGKVIAQGTPEDMKKNHHPLVRDFLIEALKTQDGDDLDFKKFNLSSKDQSEEPTVASVINNKEVKVQVSHEPQKVNLLFYGLYKRWMVLAELVGSIYLFLGQLVSTARTHPWSWRQICDQLWNVTIQSLATTAMAGFFVGAIMAVQFTLQVKEFGALGYLGGLATSATIREVGPLLMAFMLSGKVGAYTSAELGTMRVTDQIEAMKCLGVHPLMEIVFPRFVGIVVASFFLLAAGLLTSIAGGLILGLFFAGINPEEYVRHIPTLVTWPSILSGLLKCFISALVLASICTYMGYMAKGGAKGVGRAVVTTAVVTMVGIVLADWMTSFLGDVILVLYLGE